MSKKSIFHFEFEDQSAAASGSKNDRITFDLSGGEELDVQLQHGVPFIFANREACLSLARIFAMLGQGEYQNGFHIHLRKDFSGDAALPDILTISVAVPAVN